ncbi:hypothetical protein PIB30_015577 [Stylosanthes scabra]|uniref:Clp ATPase C-terminal domain-containing protein n=1 Tax=Stylosanthes scabra TaxID=79078 RepID=A0ABU6Q6Z0_9FABA|nr:hypothetical protein [Stylosanthes scabra]
MKIEGTLDAITLLANLKEEDKQYGARPVRRMIQEKVEDQLVERILRREFGKGDRIYIDTVSSSSFTKELYFMKLSNWGEVLHKRVVGQEHTVEAVVKVVQRSREVAGPKASFMFVGPRGVGKKELAKALACLLFNTEEALLLVNMSLYKEQNPVSRLKEFVSRNMQRDDRGSGGQLTEAVRHGSHSVILFHGIDKAHPQIQHEFLLPILKEGKIWDAEGRLVIDFTNAVVIMTSNVASDVILREAHNKPPYEELKKNAMAEAARSHSCFKPEFIKDTGIDEFIVFLPLSTHHIEAIVRLQLNKLEKNYASTNHKIKLEATLAAIKLLANLTDNDKKYGARSVVRVINKKVADQLVERINIRGEFESGDTIYIDTVTSSSSTQELSFKKLN